MRYYQDYYERKYGNSNFNAAKVYVLMERAKTMGALKELSADTVYLTDKIMNITWEKWFIKFLKNQYTYILSSQQVWKQILNI